MGCVAITACLFALGSYLGRNLSYGWGFVWFIAALVYYASVNPRALWQAGGATALFIAGFGAGYATISHVCHGRPRVT